MQEKTPRLVGLTELRRQATAVIDKLSDERPTFVTSLGRPVAVMLSWEAWQRLVEQERDIYKRQNR